MSFQLKKHNEDRFMNKEVSNGLRRFFLLLISFYFLFAANLSQAFPFYPFNIVPKSGTTLPTTLILGNPVTAFYTVTNNTLEQRNGNFIKYLPPNVAQVTSGVGNCGATFNLAPQGAAGDSCTLELTISGPVNGSDPNPHNHLFACFPSGITCAGTNYELNVSVITLATVSIIPTTATINVGDTLQYIATATYSDNSTVVVTGASTWQSSNTSVATIGAGTGLATGVAGGTTAITANFDGITSNAAALTVNKTLVSIAVTPGAATIDQGTTQQFVATGTFSDGSTAVITDSVTWSSNNLPVATISALGLATGVSPGTANITATKNAITSNAAILTVNKILLSIDVTPHTANISKTQTQQYTAMGHYSAGADVDITTSVTWQSSNTSVATISNTTPTQGLATAVGTGTSMISATLGSITSNSATLNVDNPLQSIAITPTSAAITAGSTQQFTAIGTFFDGSTQDITTAVDWSSLSPAVATIGLNTGLATGVSVGSSNITATSGAATHNTAVLTVSSFFYTVNDQTTVSYCNISNSSGSFACGQNSTVTHPQQIAFNPAGTFAYVTSNTDSSVSECAIDPTIGFSSCPQTLSFTTTGPIAIHPANTYAYVVDATFVNRCIINNTNGNLSNCTPTDSGITNITGIAINPAGTIAYVTKSTTNTVYQCTIDANTGLLHLCTDTTGTGFSAPIGIAINPAGTIAYIVNNTGGGADVSYCTINPSTGAFLVCTTTGSTFNSPKGIAINFAGTFAYITNSGNDTVTYCQIAGNGSLSGCIALHDNFAVPFGIAIK